MKKWIAVILLLVVCGCVRTIDERGQSSFALDPAIAAKGEAAAEVGLGLFSVLAPLLGPAGVGVAAAGTGAYALYKKKLKPKLQQAQSESELYTATAQYLVEVIDKIKKKDPKAWENTVKPAIKDEQWNTKIENAVRGLHNEPLRREVA